MSTHQLKYFIVCVASFIGWTCSLEKIDPSVKYDPCLGKVVSKFSHDKIGTTCDSPCVVKFTNQSTGAKSYLWNFGEGGTSTEANPTYTFRKTGRFEVKLTATGDGACVKESTETVTVSNANAPDPIVDFTFTYLNGNQFAPATVAFTNTSQNAVTYKWNITPQDSTTTTSPQFTFTMAGEYDVKLTATSPSGKSVVSSPKRVVIKAITFQKQYTFSPSSNEFSDGLDVIAASDGGYYVIGKVNSGAGNRLSLIRIDSKGSFITINNTNMNGESEGNALVQTADGSIVSVGRILTTTNGFDFLFTKMVGSTNWDKALGGTENEEAKSIEKTFDSGFIICGSKKNYVYLIKATSSGMIEWEKFLFANSDTIKSNGIRAKQTYDGGFMVLTNNSTLIKTNAMGIVTWSKPIAVNVGTSLNNITKGQDGSYAFCGANNGTSIIVLRTDSLGNKIGNEKILKSGLIGPTTNRIEPCKDGGYVVCGQSALSPVATSNMYLMKTDNTGTLSFDKSFSQYSIRGNSVMQTSDGGFIIAGSYGATAIPVVGKLMVIKTDQNGDVQ